MSYKVSQSDLDSQSPIPDPSLQPWGPFLVVWGIWFLASLGLVGYVWYFGSPIPIWDELTVLDLMIDGSAYELWWLWYPQAEHRMPLQKLLLLLLYHCTQGDVRSAEYFNALTLSALAAVLLVAIRRVRGATRYEDAVFPIVFLHWGHSECLLFGFQLAFVVPVFLTGMLLALVLIDGVPRSRTGVWLAGLVLVLLSFAGPVGASYLLPVAVWFGYLSVRFWQVRDYFRAIVLGVNLFLALIILAWSTVDRPEPVALPPSAGGWAILRTTLQFFSLSFGWIDVHQQAWRILGPLAALLLAMTAAMLVHVLACRPEERPRALGLLCLLGGGVALALGLGWGRSGFGEAAGLQARYILLATLLPACVVSAWTLYGVSRVAVMGRSLVVGLFIALAGLGSREGTVWGAQRADLLGKFEHHLVHEGWPRHQLAAVHGALFHGPGHPTSDNFQRLADAEYGPFTHLQPDPRFQSVAVGLTPAAVRGLRWDAKTRTARFPDNEDAHLTFATPGAREVRGVRIRYRHENADGGPPNFQFFWRRRDEAYPSPRYYDDIGDASQKRFWCPGMLSEEQAPPAADATVLTATVWICAPVDEIRLHPDTREGKFQIVSISLLLAP